MMENYISYLRGACVKYINVKGGARQQREEMIYLYKPRECEN